MVDRHLDRQRLERVALALLVLVAAVAQPRDVSAGARRSSDDVVTASSNEDQVVTHHELVRAPVVADARTTFPAVALRVPPRPQAAAPRPISGTVQVAQARARRAFTLPRVRRFRPSDPDDY